jgi:hypothetical protein
MTILRSLNNLTTLPSESIIKTVVNEHPNNIGCGESTKIRLLFALQLIVSLVALPVLLVVGLISFVFRACAGEGKEALNELGRVLKEHILIAIPTSAVGIFASLETTGEVFVSRTAAFIRSECEPVEGRNWHAMARR